MDIRGLIQRKKPSLTNVINYGYFQSRYLATHRVVNIVNTCKPKQKYRKSLMWNENPFYLVIGHWDISNNLDFFSVPFSITQVAYYKHFINDLTIWESFNSTLFSWTPMGSLLSRSMISSPWIVNANNENDCLMVSSYQ